MEIKVRALDDSEQKSKVQIEEELLQKHEEKFEGTPTTEQAEVKSEAPVEDVPQVETQELTEDQVLSHIKNRYDKEFSSVDEMFSEQKSQEELPEDVASYLKYKKETGRGINDYVKLQRDFTDANPDDLLREYLKTTESALDDEDIDVLMDEYSFDAEIDEESHIKKTKLAKKKAIATARKYFTEQQEQYKQPLESRSEAKFEDSEEYKQYKQSLSDAKSVKERNEAKSQIFRDETSKVFGTDFKGFDFAIGDNTVTYSPGKAEEIMNNQSTPMNFLTKYLDKDGVITDAAGYHKALAVAMNPEKFAQFFYEQGKSNATEDVMRKTKNINMTTRNAPQVKTKDGTQFRSISSNSSNGLKIRSIKRK